MENKVVSFEQFLSEGKTTGGNWPDYEFSSLAGGMRLSDIYINQKSKTDFLIKLGIYSGGSNQGIPVKTPQKIVDLTDKMFAGMRGGADADTVKAGEDAEYERHKLMAELQKQIFDAVTKEFDALDKKLESIVTSIVKKF